MSLNRNFLRSIIKADPAHLLDPVEIDLAKLSGKYKEHVRKDLKLEEKKGVNVSTPW